MKNFSIIVCVLLMGCSKDSPTNSPNTNCVSTVTGSEQVVYDKEAVSNLFNVKQFKSGAEMSKWADEHLKDCFRSNRIDTAKIEKPKRRIPKATIDKPAE